MHPSAPYIKPQYIGRQGAKALGSYHRRDSGLEAL